MVRISKQQERRQRFPRRPKIAGVKTGPRSNKHSLGFREHPNAVAGDLGQQVFISKIR
jgi:hypothetical protein